MKYRHDKQTALPESLTAQPINPVTANGLVKHNPVPRTSSKKPISRSPTLIRNPNHKFYSSTKTVQSIASTISGANESRRYLLLQNVGTVTAYFGFGVTPKLDGTDAIEIPPGFGIEFDGIVPNNAIEAISTGQTIIAIIEGSEA